MSTAVADTDNPSGWLNQIVPSPKYRVFFKMSDFAAFTSKIFVFLDEHPDSINNEAFGVWMSDPNNSNNAYIFDIPAWYHNGACGFSFIDGHCEVHKWRDSRTMQPMTYTGNITLGIHVPKSPDAYWITEHASFPN
jgi:prepilin-type processing-associated H-X9-DG protein